MPPIRNAGSPIGHRPAQQTTEPKKTAATAAEKAAPATGGWLKPAAARPKPSVTGADVVQSPELATRYALNFDHLPFRTTEEVLEFVHHNLDAAKGGAANAGTLASNILYSLNELESRLPEGKLRAQLYAARQGLHGGSTLGDGLTKPALENVAKALSAFAKSAHIDPASSKWDRQVFEPAAQVTRFRGAMKGLDDALWGSYAGAPADAKQKLRNSAAELNTELAKVTPPTDPNAKKVFARAVDELSVILKSVVKGAESAQRADIAASATQGLQTLQRLGKAVAD